MKDELELIAGITALAGSSFGGAITVATVPTVVSAVAPAAGVAGWLGFTTTVTTIVAAPVSVPVGGVVAVGALLTYGGYKAYNFIKNKKVKEV